MSAAVAGDVPALSPGILAAAEPFLIVLGILSAAFAGFALHHARTLRIRNRQLESQCAQLQQEQADARAENLAKSDFLANVSHELRTPFQGILGMLSLLRETHLEPIQAEYIDCAHESAVHLLSLLNDLLDLSKLEARKMEIVPEPVHIVRLVRDVGSLMSAAALAKHIGFHTVVDEQVPHWIRADDTRVRQVLFNLLSNAVKFTNHGNVQLHVDLTHDSHAHPFIRFIVSDEGIGMDPATLARLFHRFAQGSPDREHRIAGSGLGLEISQRLARLMGGDITVSSQPGVGSTFTFSFPLKSCSEPEAAAACEREIADAVGTLRVLVSEDHPINREYIKAVLSQLGHEPVLCSNGREAVDALVQGDFDVVLMDLHTPVMDGFTASRLIRALPGKKGRTPIIAFTADAQDTARRLSREAGMDDFLQKPVRPSELASALARFGGRNHLQRQTNGIPKKPITSGLVDPETIGELCSSLGIPGYQSLAFGLCDEQGDALQSLEHALVSGDRGAALSSAHDLKGAALTLGFTGIAHAADHIENFIRKNDPEGPRIAWTQLKSLLQPTRDEAMRVASARPPGPRPDLAPSEKSITSPP